jgi:hypothetical protein
MQLSNRKKVIEQKPMTFSEKNLFSGNCQGGCELH